ncbi:MAG: hypothetical protein PVF83_19015 [Anaerolineales bacterium]|jgi:nucleoid-associated protein YgaU
MSSKKQNPKIDGDEGKTPESTQKKTTRKKLKITGGIKSAPKKKEYKVIKVHTLGKNETWTHLAAKYYGNTTEPYWRHIYEFNKEMVGDNYKRIWGGMEIKIPELPEELKKKEE